MTEQPPHHQPPRHEVGSRPRTTALLDDLLTNTLDPGYRLAAERAHPRRRWEGLTVWLGCLLIGFVLVVAYQQTHRSAPARATARKDLISRIKQVQTSGDRIDAQITGLAQQVTALRNSRLSASTGSSLIGQEIASGSIAVQGPGVRVSVAEPATGAVSNGLSTPGPIITDSDVRAVVNQLWSAGAEAIAVNGVRLTPNSTIRIAGDSILVDFQPISSPYSVAAIGSADSLLVNFADSAEARALKTKEAVNSISFSFETHTKLQLPAGGLSQLRFAEKGAAQTGGARPAASASESPR